MKNILLAVLAFFVFSATAVAAVNLNTANKDQLEAVKGIGPKKAEAIIEYRKKNGSFKTVDDLKKVSGFGDKSVATIRAELTVGGDAAKGDKKAAKIDAKAARNEGATEKKDVKAEKKDAKADKKEVKAEDKKDKK
jgi:competence protein ComEA